MEECSHDPSTIRLWHTQAKIFEQLAVGQLGVLGQAVTVLTYKAVAHPAYSTVGTSFPVIMHDASGKPVAGEIYIVDDGTLERLDQLEREGRSYDRVMIEATFALPNEGQLPTRAFIYVGRRIASGICSLVARSTKR